TPCGADRAENGIDDERADVGDPYRQHTRAQREQRERQGEATVGAPDELERPAAVAEDAEEAAQGERLGRGGAAGRTRRMHGSCHQLSPGGPTRVMSREPRRK